MFTYGLGRGIPVIAAGTFTGIAREYSGLSKWSVGFEKLPELH